MTNAGFNGFPAPIVLPDGVVSAAKLSAPQLWGRLVSGSYYVTAGQNATSTSAVLTNGTLRLTPWFVPNACTLSRVGCDISSAGDGGSTVRIGIYADNGSGYPGALVLDAGSEFISGAINGASNTVQEVVVSKALAAGLYWVGGVVQGVTVTQPTVRIPTGNPMLGNIPLGTSAPSAAVSVLAVTQTSVTAALPTTFTTTVSLGTITPRIHVKVA